MKAIADLRSAEEDKLALERELAALEEEEKALEEEESECVSFPCLAPNHPPHLYFSPYRFWAAHSLTALAETRAQGTFSSLQSALAHTQSQLQTLARTNVYNDAFCIGHDGVFGTVNGLRLGRVSGVNVEWAEVNAAWGQTLLLLSTIARKLEFVFDT